MPLDTEYPNILTSLKSEIAPGRTESHSFLLWFLKNYYRLEDTEAADAVCDGLDDKGIDGIFVDDNLENIDVFQCKLVQNPAKTLGDTQLKEFVGTVSQLENPAHIEEIAATTANTELANLLSSANVSKLVEDGYSIRGIFLTNIDRDQNAIEFLAKQDQLSLFDKSELENSYIPTDPTGPVATEVSFDVFGNDCSQYQIGDVSVLVAPLKASELINLDGIANSELFAWNVRGDLGRTKVNKDIGRSIDDPDEHKNFLMYHNGLTILCEELKYENDKVTINGYSVVNGCQSLTSLYSHRAKVTDELRLLARLIKLPAGSDLAEKITHHSNNQNPINARDLQSNSTIQRRLQNEFQERFAGGIFYRIKRGESDQGHLTIDNDEAGRCLLAFDLRQPWTCHQSYKILDELHGQIFARPEVNATRILAVVDIQEEIIRHLGEVNNQLFARYRLSRYFLLYLVRESLEADEIGREFCAHPEAFLTDDDSRKRLQECIGMIVKDLIIDLNAELKGMDDDGKSFDYKRELKSPSPVRDLSKNIISQYQKAVLRERASGFGDEWKSSESTSDAA